MQPYEGNKTHEECVECSSMFILSNATMSALCRECAYWLYGKQPCQHRFHDGSCIECGWDGSTSKYIDSLKDAE